VLWSKESRERSFFKSKEDSFEAREEGGNCRQGESVTCEPQAVQEGLNEETEDNEMAAEPGRGRINETLNGRDCLERHGKKKHRSKSDELRSKDQDRLPTN